LLSIGLLQLIHRSFSYDFETEKCQLITMATYSYYSSTDRCRWEGFSQDTSVYSLVRSQVSTAQLWYRVSLGGNWY